MKKVFALVCALSLLIVSVLSVQAAEGKVTYVGNAGDLIFEPGSDYSPTDLFPDFKDVMPGDTLTQKITVRNDADNNVKVKIYMRSLGAHADSVEFLSKLGLRVEKSADNEMEYMFDAQANEKAQLTDWVCLGTLYSGGEVNLDVILEVPAELDNMFQKKVGYLDWEFMIEEFPVEESDPDAPQTGDPYNTAVWVGALFAVSAVLVVIIIIRKRRKDEDEAKEI